MCSNQQESTQTHTPQPSAFPLAHSPQTRTAIATQNHAPQPLAFPLAQRTVLKLIQRLHHRPTHRSLWLSPLRSAQFPNSYSDCHTDPRTAAFGFPPCAAHSTQTRTAIATQTHAPQPSAFSLAQRTVLKLIQQLPHRPTHRSLWLSPLRSAQYLNSYSDCRTDPHTAAFGFLPCAAHSSQTRTAIATQNHAPQPLAFPLEHSPQTRTAIAVQGWRKTRETSPQSLCDVPPTQAVCVQPHSPKCLHLCVCVIVCVCVCVIVCVYVCVCLCDVPPTQAVCVQPHSPKCLHLCVCVIVCV